MDTNALRHSPSMPLLRSPQSLYSTVCTSCACLELQPARPLHANDYTTGAAKYSTSSAQPRAITARIPIPPLKPALAVELAPTPPDLAGRRRVHSRPVVNISIRTIRRDVKGMLKLLKARLHGKSRASLSTSHSSYSAVLPRPTYYSGGGQLPIVTMRASGPGVASESG
jgi:hypothetical protein